MVDANAKRLEIEDAYGRLRAMGLGHAQVAHQVCDLSELPGFKRISFEFRDLRIVEVDIVTSTPTSLRCAGLVTLYYQGEPAWTLSYEGYCQEVGMSFLRRARTVAVTGKEAMSGRGPRTYLESDLEYHNVSTGCRFGDIQGEECVFGDRKKRILGRVTYRSKRLVP